MTCPDCGEPLDDFSPCACALDPRPRKRLNVLAYRRDGMRGMVARKLERKAAEKKAREGA